MSSSIYFTFIITLVYMNLFLSAFYPTTNAMNFIGRIRQGIKESGKKKKREEEESLQHIQMKLIQYLSTPDEREYKSFIETLKTLKIKKAIFICNDDKKFKFELKEALQDFKTKIVVLKDNQTGGYENKKTGKKQLETLVFDSNLDRIYKIGEGFPVIHIYNNDWTIKGLRWVNVKQSQINVFVDQLKISTSATTRSAKAESLVNFLRKKLITVLALDFDGTIIKGHSFNAHCSLKTLAEANAKEKEKYLDPKFMNIMHKLEERGNNLYRSIPLDLRELLKAIRGSEISLNIATLCNDVNFKKAKSYEDLKSFFDCLKIDVKSLLAIPFEMFKENCLAGENLVLDVLEGNGFVADRIYAFSPRQFKESEFKNREITVFEDSKLSHLQLIQQDENCASYNILLVDDNPNYFASVVGNGYLGILVGDYRHAFQFSELSGVAAVQTIDDTAGVAFAAPAINLASSPAAVSVSA